MEVIAKRRVRGCFYIALAGVIVQIGVIVLKINDLIPLVPRAFLTTSAHSVACLSCGICTSAGLGLCLLGWDYVWWTAITYRYQGVAIPDPTSFLTVLAAAFCFFSVVCLAASLCEPLARAVFDSVRETRSG